MWSVAKIKTNEEHIFKEKLRAIFGDTIKFYSPKICCQKYFKNKLICVLP